MAEKLSFEGLKSAADTTKQIITLSTGVIALTVTFLEKIVQPATQGARLVPWTMFAAWIFFGLTIVVGVMVLGAVTGTLDALDRRQNELPVSTSQEEAIASLANGKNIRIPARVMSFLFLIGMALTIATGFLLLR